MDVVSSPVANPLKVMGDVMVVLLREYGSRGA
jgi:hypothetical protein